MNGRLHVALPCSLGRYLISQPHSYPQGDLVPPTGPTFTIQEHRLWHVPDPMRFWLSKCWNLPSILMSWIMTLRLSTSLRVLRLMEPDNPTCLVVGPSPSVMHHVPERNYCPPRTAESCLGSRESKGVVKVGLGVSDKSDIPVSDTPVQSPLEVGGWEPPRLFDSVVHVLGLFTCTRQSDHQSFMAASLTLSCIFCLLFLVDRFKNKQLMFLSVGIHALCPNPIHVSNALPHSPPHITRRLPSTRLVTS